MFVTVEIRPSEGGDDAVVFADEITETVAAWLRRNHMTPETDRRTRTVNTVTYQGPIGLVSDLSGIHRVQRVGATSKGARHTSTVTVAVVNTEKAAPVCLDDRDIEWSTFRATGPGGQHRNKNATAVRMRHIPTDIRVVATRERSLRRNLDAARAELERRVAGEYQQERAARVDQVRRSQTSGKPKDYTHNMQRAEVIDHQRNRKIRQTDFASGRLDRWS